MVDISMCMNESCTKKASCYRYIAIPDKYYQSYSNFIQNEQGDCDYFRPNKNNCLTTKQ